MKWSIKDMMAITVIVALIFLARVQIRDVAPSYLILALYLGVATVASVLAWKAAGVRQATLVTYATFAWLFGLYFLERDAGDLYVTRICVVGILLGIASALAVWLTLRNQ